jgi:hypothetical protein
MTKQFLKQDMQPVSLEDLQQRAVNISEANTVNGATFMAQLIAGQFDTNDLTTQPPAKN